MKTLASTSSARPYVAGHLYATCTRDDSGKCILSRKEFKTPIHISKPYWNGSNLLLNLMCPTAGMLAGDSVDLEIEIEEDACLTLSNPSSMRIHKMDPESEATWTQTFHVAKGGFLESNPEWLILQGESAFTQKTGIRVEKGGELFFIEAIAPGRIAHQESFLFRRFSNRLSLRYDNELSLLEKHRVQPENGTHSSWSNELGDACPFYISVLLASEKLSDSSDFWKSIYELQSDGARIGASKLAKGPCWSLKILGSDPIAARRALNAVREQFYREIDRRPADLRR
ncbi:urease accessory protein UreD [Pelagicoccus mobilis]|uniref:Urease accessory protein UreD n=1 Tax=Pelagicoccus mobilis TaxID=415221 RepID=A0A934S0J5_9BACT|nr:urease accessory protein UreD [Pelagicoccus mobilis]MBK1880142.1 urease accessory protein UreD [Pelagicoccus mobilis]